MAGADGLTWTYTAQRLNSDLTGDRITLTATDLPGNHTLVKETLLAWRATFVIMDMAPIPGKDKLFPFMSNLSR